MRAFLWFLESRGGGEVAASDLEAVLAKDGLATRTALVSEGIVRSAPLATTHPCDELSCAREVREEPREQDGTRRFLAVCSQSPRACETQRLGEADLEQRAVAIDALVGALQRELAIDPTTRPEEVRRASGEDPVFLGEQPGSGTSRDVFLVRRPSAPSLRALLAARRFAARPALVLVPTARAIDPDMLAAHDAGHVQIAVLTDALTVSAKAPAKLVASARLRVIPRADASAAQASDLPTPAAPARVRSAVLEKLPRATRWSEVTFFRCEVETALGVEIDRRTRRVTARDLGMAASISGEPLREYTLLQRICDGNGVFDTKPWGSQDNGKQVVSQLRRALCAAFEIAESPIETYSRSTKSWKTRFRALAGPPDQFRALMRKMKD